MNPQKKNNPSPSMSEGHPEPFIEPRTMPGWDLTGYLDMPHAHTSLADMNGAAYEQNTPWTGTRDDDSADAV